MGRACPLDRTWFRQLYLNEVPLEGVFEYNIETFKNLPLFPWAQLYNICRLERGSCSDKKLEDGFRRQVGLPALSHYQR